MKSIPIEIICKIIDFSDNKVHLFFKLSKLEKHFYENLKKQKHLMLKITFVMERDIELSYLKNNSSLNFILNLSCSDIIDGHLLYFKNLKIVDISYCTKLTDNAFVNFKGIHSLDMEGCNQKGITDKAFNNFKGIHSLNMEGCNQKNNYK